MNKSVVDYEWVRVRDVWKMTHTNRIHITLTKHGEWRVWDNVALDTVTIKHTLCAARLAAELYYSNECYHVD